MPEHVGPLLAIPTPSDGSEFDSVTVSPGLAGFVFFFAVAVVLLLLVVDMTRRVRRVRAKARVEERMAARRGEAGQDGEGSAADGSDGGGSRTDAPDGEDQGADGSDGGVDGEGPGSEERDDQGPGSDRKPGDR